MTVKLIGTDTAGDTVFATGSIRATKFTCAVGGSLSEINVYCTVSDNVRVALYSDNAGTINAILGESADTAITQTGWKPVSLAAPVNVTATTVYWLAMQNTTSNKGGTYRLVEAVSAYKVQAYGAFSEGGFSSQTTVEYALQGYGTITGWANIATLKGATATDLASWNGATLTDLASWSGANV